MAGLLEVASRSGICEAVKRRSPYGVEVLAVCSRNTYKRNGGHQRAREVRLEGCIRNIHRPLNTLGGGFAVTAFSGHACDLKER